MVQTHLASGSPFFELYVQFSLSNEAFPTSTSTAVREEYMTGMASTSSGWQSTSNRERYETSTRRDDVLPMMSTDEGTSYVVDDRGLDNESNVDPPREPDSDGAEVALFSKLENDPTEPEDGEGGSNEE
ncbi:hypothetical protein PVK06_038463 [Gossypium arboreum]|uniref:Uncharacterized protein n=1 Tax=Gossypium arboreum TaxID=29729 RepID=A0ABR0N090_GOSAR|nr:hypothetical protein PVK06_038463 [Gossypium arboreum]